MSNLLRSGWCPPDGHTEAQHRVCQMRQNDPDERIRLRPCGCEEHGGHDSRKAAGQRPVSGGAHETIGATEKFEVQYEIVCSSIERMIRRRVGLI